MVDASATGDEGLWAAEGNEYDLILLEYLFYRTGELVTRSDIWEHVFEDGSGGSSNAVDVYIGYLRRKLNTGDLPDLIQTRREQGYILESPDT